MIRSRGDVFRFAVVGDLHTHWDDVDLAQFAGADYDLLYFTGDLGGGTPDSTLRVPRALLLQQVGLSEIAAYDLNPLTIGVQERG